eukprot:2633510-Rhodomonas_salina.1
MVCAASDDEVAGGDLVEGLEAEAVATTHGLHERAVAGVPLLLALLPPVRVEGRLVALRRDAPVLLQLSAARVAPQAARRPEHAVVGGCQVRCCLGLHQQPPLRAMRLRAPGVLDHQHLLPAVAPHKHRDHCMP